MTRSVACTGTLGAGGLVGYLVAKRMRPVELPQTVAAFHSLVGGAAVLTAFSAGNPKP
jgi:NAD(P) transhydrogenase